MADSLSRRLVRSLLERQRRGLPSEIREKMVLHLMDTVGIALAARRGDPGAVRAVEALRSGGTAGECRVLGSDDRLPPAMAAFANSALGHTMDFDDIHDVAALHPTSSTLPAALAAADLCGASGRSLVEAVALGNELMCRLGMAFEDSEPRVVTRWFLSQLFGYLSNSFAAGLVLGLSEDELVSALGLGYMQMAGGKESAFAGGSNARAIYPAFGSLGGVHAALLARAGMVGPSTALEGRTGLFRNYLGVEPRPEQLDRLFATDDWAFSATDVKPWPSCRLSHPYVAAVLSIRDRVRLGEVERVVVRVDELAAQLCRPLETRRRPRTLQDAKYSIPFMVAFTLTKGQVDLETLVPTALDDAKVLSLVDRVEIVEDVPRCSGIAPGYVTVFTPGGSVASQPSLPPHLTPEQITSKFMSCCRFAGLGASATELRDRLLHLEEIQVAGLFAGIGFPGIGE